jgi:hypothetical protein
MDEDEVKTSDLSKMMTSQQEGMDSSSRHIYSREHQDSRDRMAIKTIYEQLPIDPFIFMRMFYSYPFQAVQPSSWEPFELCSFVIEGVETKLLISPVLDGDLAIPIMSNESSENQVVPVSFFSNTHDCLHCEQSNRDRISSALSQRLKIWQAVMRYCTFEKMLTFSENEIEGILVLRHTINRGLCLYFALTKLMSDMHDSEEYLSFLVRYQACKVRFDQWNKIWPQLIVGTCNADRWDCLWKEMQQFRPTSAELQFMELLLCRVGPTGKE